MENYPDLINFFKSEILNSFLIYKISKKRHDQIYNNNEIEYYQE